SLIERVVARDLRAFEALYRIYHPRLDRFLGLVTPRPTIVEEALNDTMLVVWRRAATYSGECKVSTWIFAIAYRTVLKALRTQDEPVDAGAADELASEDAAPSRRRSASRRRRRSRARSRRSRPSSARSSSSPTSTTLPTPRSRASSIAPSTP